jgi:hypothetical protein
MRVMRHIRGAHSLLLLLSASLLGAQTTSRQETASTDGTDATIMAPVTALASYMSRVEGNILRLCGRWTRHQSRISHLTFLAARMQRRSGIQVFVTTPYR